MGEGIMKEKLRTKLELESPVMSEIELKIYKYLQKRDKFDPWHTLSTIYSRDYAKWIINNLNQLLNEDDGSWVVEVGCGLGEIIGNINWPHKAGYDLDEGVIKAAKFLRGGPIE